MKLRKDRREQRRREAVERNQRWAELTPLEQLQILNEREVTATRQRAKIKERLSKEAR
jgi:hypothetical protein